jgi:hypothetical protein
MRLDENLHLFVHPPRDRVIVGVQQIIHRRTHQHRQTMRFAIIDREQRYHAGAADFHQPANRRQRGFIGREEIDKLAVLGAVILIGQIVAPVALAHRLNKRFDAIVTRVHTPAKATSTVFHT